MKPLFWIGPGRFVQSSFCPPVICVVLSATTMNWSFIRNGYRPIPGITFKKGYRPCEAGWNGVCVTGGEPTLHPDLPELLDQIRHLELLVKLDTNGTRPEVLDSLVSRNLIDYLAMDIKGPLDQEMYGRCAGVPTPIAEIKKSMDLIFSGRVHGEFRTTVIPQWHTPSVLARMALELKGAPKWTQQEFNPARTLDPALGSKRPSHSQTTH